MPPIDEALAVMKLAWGGSSKMALAGPHCGMRGLGVSRRTPDEARDALKRFVTK